MGRADVYSWPLAANLKAVLEDTAREERTRIGELLDRMARHWLGDRAARAGGGRSREDYGRSPSTA